MNWKSLFSSARNMTSEEARIFLKKKGPESYQLVDVRQPKEYEKEHLPGAVLIPVRELLSRVDELNPQLTTLVYCRNGFRSRAACQLLRGKGFHDVFNILGGIKAWNGFRLSGPQTKGMEFFVSGDFKDVFHMAYSMEAGLKQFYLAMVEKVELKGQKDLLRHMAHFEDGHMAMLTHQFRQSHPPVGQEENISSMEGGFDKEKTLNAYGNHIETMEDIIHLGMMFETQAYDLYGRLARKSENDQTRNFYLQMAAEEKVHLAQLERELDKILAGLSPGKPEAH